MSGYLRGLSVLLAIAWPTGYALATAPGPSRVQAAIAYADQPVRLVRGTGLYRAGRGVALRDDDMLETGDATIQLDAGGATLAIGPATRIYVRGGEIVLLEGWLKLIGRPERPLTLASANLQLSSAGASATLHAAGPVAEVFAESGEVPVLELNGGRPGRAVKVGSEQFASRKGNQALRILSRPPAVFVDAMPRDLRDTLVPLAMRAGTTAPRLEHAGTYAELAPWVALHKPLRQRLYQRFHPPSSVPRAVAGRPSLTPDRQ